jgi:hypothetical protein
MTTANQIRTAQINKLQRHHPGTRRQRSYHGCNDYSVQFFNGVTGVLEADYNLVAINALEVHFQSALLGHAYTQADAEKMLADARKAEADEEAALREGPNDHK